MTREEMLDWLYRLRSQIYVYMPKNWLIPMNDALDMAIKALEQDPKTGHWIEIAQYSDGNHKIECSECESHIFDRGHANSFNVKNKYKYCPNCGAKMVEPQESEDKE